MGYIDAKIVKYLKEFDQIKGGLIEQLDYIEKCDCGMYIRDVLMLRMYNLEGQDGLAKVMVNNESRFNPYICHEKLVSCLLFDIETQQLKKYCRESLMANQRVCLLLENEQLPNIGVGQRTMALEHALLYYQTYHTKISRDKLNVIKNKLMRSIKYLDLKVGETQLDHVYHSEVTKLIMNGYGQTVFSYDFAHDYNIINNEKYHHNFEYTKSGMITVESFNRLPLLSYYDREAINQYQRIASIVEGELQSTSTHSKNVVQKRVGELISLEVEAEYSNKALNLLLYILCGLAKQQVESVDFEELMTTVVGVSASFYDIEPSQSAYALFDLLSLSEEYNLDVVILNKHLIIPPKMKKLFKDELYPGFASGGTIDLFIFPTAVESNLSEFYHQVDKENHLHLYKQLL